MEKSTLDTLDTSLDASSSQPPQACDPEKTHQSTIIVDDESPAPSLLKELSLLDRLLTPLVLIAMIVGVIIGEFVSGVQEAFNTATFADVSLRQSIFPLISETPTLSLIRLIHLSR